MDVIVSKKDRLVAFFRTEQFVDCVFKIEGQEVKAHKLILACSSPVFERMLFGEMAEDSIEISDINMQEFKQVLDHIYTENIEISSVVNAWNLLYIANKYLLDDLINVCLGYIRNNLTMRTVVLSYEYADVFDLLEIKKKCLDEMVNYFNGVFYCDYHIKPSTLRAILDQISSFNIDVLVKVINWALVECENRQKQSTPTPSEIVELLREENILKYFTKDCLNIVKCEGRLLQKTLLILGEILEWSKDPFDLSVPLITTPKHCKMRKELKIAGRIDLHQNEHFWCGFSVTKQLIIFGISINTPMEPLCLTKNFFYEGVVCVRIYKCDHKADIDIVEPMMFNQLIPYHSTHFYLNFHNLVVFEPDVLYKFGIYFNNTIDKRSTNLHCFYMENKLLNDNTVVFYEINGTIIKGLSYYPY